MTAASRHAIRAGDALELRGPIGGYFVWEQSLGGPLLLVGGGSGVVPLRAMVRHRAAHSSTVDTRLLLSSRSGDDVLYRDELSRLAAGDGLAVHQTFTREPPAGWSGFARRVDADVLSHVGPAPSQRRGSSSAGRRHLSSEPPTCSSGWGTTPPCGAPHRGVAVGDAARLMLLNRNAVQARTGYKGGAE